jgi:RNase adapter protein RapZ
VSDDTTTSRPVVLVTGLSGAGRTTALKMLEDLGYEAVDNLPLSLLATLLSAEAANNDRQPLAIGVDIRNRDFAVDAFLTELDRLTADHDIDVQLLFLDCDDATLLRRYTETRRRHPLAMDRPVPDGIRLERTVLSALRDRADTVIDTSQKTLWTLKERIGEQFGLDQGPGLGVNITSFSYRHGVPREADLVFDVRFLANPHYVDDLRPLTGQDGRIGAYISADPDFSAFLDALTGMLRILLPRYEAEGKSYLTIAVGCTGGRHRSVYTAERLVEWLENQGRRFFLFHRDMDGQGGQDGRDML